MSRQKGVYWTEIQENLVLQWLSADTRQEYRIYNELHARVYQMQEIILHRYFTCPPARYTELMRDCCQHVFLHLRAFKPERQTKAYSYVQTLIKNYCMDRLVMHRIWKSQNWDDLHNRVELDNQDYINDMEEVLMPPQDDIQVDFDELRQLAIQRLQKDLTSLRMRLFRLRLDVKRTKGRGKSAKNVWLKRSVGLIKRREWLKLTIKFIQKHNSPDINHNALNEYIHANSLTLYIGSIVNYTNEYIGVIGQSKTGKTIVKNKGEYNYGVEIPYVMDDYCPNDSNKRHGHKKSYKNQKEYLYF